MSYDPSLPTTLDRIRLIVGDTSDDLATELFPDETYTATIAEYGASWKIAAAVMAEAVAVRIEQDPTSFTAQGDMSVGWSDRTRSLRDTAARLRREAAAEDATGSNVLTSVALGRDGTVGRGEYRATAYARLRR